MLKKLFSSLVCIEQTDLQVEHGLTRNTETKMTGLNDAGVNRTHRHLKYAFALHRAKDVTRTSQRLGLGEEVKVLAKRIHPVGEIIVQCHPAWIRMT